MEINNNAFEKTLRDVRYGHAVTEASEKLAQLVQAVRASGKGGRFTLTLSVKPASRGDTSTLMVEDDIAVKLPKQEKPQSVFFATDQNLLQRNDPNQKEFVLKTVPGEKVEPEQLKQVNG